ncbi:uncharacterized protein LOC133343305 isoform X2 [Lethenteron reissneri]|uniref:uncharacterized protein LOC133343305 isoform X2 n=1 Tax=Lethenteron reissneri TaxID=7753 RepID=UPI002AB70491|nr:uncharacterized protein LOC133343305 isoform X2 [Lethenteron reissneri]
METLRPAPAGGMKLSETPSVANCTENANPTCRPDDPGQATADSDHPPDASCKKVPTDGRFKLEDWLSEAGLSAASHENNNNVEILSTAMHVLQRADVMLQGLAQADGRAGDEERRVAGAGRPDGVRERPPSEPPWAPYGRDADGLPSARSPRAPPCNPLAARLSRLGGYDGNAQPWRGSVGQPPRSPAVAAESEKWRSAERPDRGPPAAVTCGRPARPALLKLDGREDVEKRRRRRQLKAFQVRFKDLCDDADEGGGGGSSAAAKDGEGRVATQADARPEVDAEPRRTLVSKVPTSRRFFRPLHSRLGERTLHSSATQTAAAPPEDGAGSAQNVAAPNACCPGSARGARCGQWLDDGPRRAPADTEYRPSSSSANGEPRAVANVLNAAGAAHVKIHRPVETACGARWLPATTSATEPTKKLCGDAQMNGDWPTSPIARRTSPCRDGGVKPKDRLNSAQTNASSSPSTSIGASDTRASDVTGVQPPGVERGGQETSVAAVSPPACSDVEVGQADEAVGQAAGSSCTRKEPEPRRDTLNGAAPDGSATEERGRAARPGESQASADREERGGASDAEAMPRNDARRGEEASGDAGAKGDAGGPENEPKDESRTAPVTGEGTSGVGGGSGSGGGGGGGSGGGGESQASQNEVNALRERLAAMEEVLRASQDTIKLLLEVIRQLERADATRRGVEHDFRQQESMLHQALTPPRGCRAATALPSPHALLLPALPPPAATPDPCQEGQDLRPTMAAASVAPSDRHGGPQPRGAARKNGKGCFWFL